MNPVAFKRTGNDIRSHIHKIEPATKRIKVEVPDSHSTDQSIKYFIRQQIQLSELKILARMEVIERKLDQLLALKSCVTEQPDQNDNESHYEQEEHIIEEYISDDPAVDHADEPDDYNNTFPITDEDTFDLFMLKMKDPAYRNTLVNQRHHLTRNCGTRSFNVSVKDFLRMHVDLAVCIKYSISGYGSRGTKKKKVDGKTLAVYVHECFNRSQPDMCTIDQVTKAITQFWGRSQDTFTKMHDRTLKKDSLSS